MTTPDPLLVQALADAERHCEGLYESYEQLRAAGHAWLSSAAYNAWERADDYRVELRDELLKLEINAISPDGGSSSDGN